MKKVAVVSLLVFVLLLLFVSCNPDQSKKSGLIGRWKSGGRYMTIKDNGSFFVENPLGGTQLGKWSESNGKLVMTFDDDPTWHWVDASYTLDSDILSFTDENGTNWNWVKQN